MADTTPKKKINELPEATTVNDTDIMITQTTNSTPKTNKITMNTLLNKVKTWLLGVAPFSYVKNLTSDVQTQINQVNSNLSTHSHAWSTVTGKPSVFSPSTHNHTWNEITGKPSTYTPTSHNQAWSTITNKPTTFTPSSHTHDDRYQISSMENSTAIPGFEGQNIAGFMHRFSNNTGKYMSETFMTYGNYLYTQVKNNGAWTGFRKQIDNRYIEDVEYALYPTLDNARDLGGSVFRWRGAYLTNAPSITSDKNKKKDIKSLDLESITRFCNGLNPVSYKLIDGESGRTHFGLIAQEVEEAMQNANLTSMDFAGFIKDGNNYFLRYEEFIPLIIKIIQNLEKRVSDLDKNH